MLKLPPSGRVLNSWSQCWSGRRLKSAFEISNTTACMRGVERETGWNGCWWLNRSDSIWDRYSEIEIQQYLKGALLQQTCQLPGASFCMTDQQPYVPIIARPHSILLVECALYRSAIRLVWAEVLSRDTRGNTVYWILLFGMKCRAKLVQSRVRLNSGANCLNKIIIFFFQTCHSLNSRNSFCGS